MPTEKELTLMQTQAIEQLDWLHNVAGLKWVDVAGRLGVKQPSLSRWVRRTADKRTPPSPAYCREIARLYEQVKAEKGIL